MRRRKNLPFLPQDSGPTGLSTGRPSSIICNQNQLRGSPFNLPSVAPSSSAHAAVKQECEENAPSQDSPSQALLKLSRTNDEENVPDSNWNIQEPQMTSKTNEPSKSTIGSISSQVRNQDHKPTKPLYIHKSHSGITAVDPELQFYVMDYAAGIALRNGVLLPLLEKDYSSEIKDLMSLQLGRFYRGDRLLKLTKPCETEKNPSNSNNDQFLTCRIENISASDAPSLSSWFYSPLSRSGGDRFLPHTDILWSEKWERRCLGDGSYYNPDHEMIKLVIDLSDGRESTTSIILGTAYLERHSLDPALECTLLPGCEPLVDLPRATVIREMRVAPYCNPAVLERYKYCYENICCDSDNDGLKLQLLPLNHLDIMSYMFDNILNRSLVYGTSGVTVLCPKQTEFEIFYKSNMGKPWAMDENGRYLFRSHGKDRMNAIQRGFQRHISQIQDSLAHGPVKPMLCGYTNLALARIEQGIISQKKRAQDLANTPKQDNSNKRGCIERNTSSSVLI